MLISWKSRVLRLDPQLTAEIRDKIAVNILDPAPFFYLILLFNRRMIKEWKRPANSQPRRIRLRVSLTVAGIHQNSSAGLYRNYSHNN